MATNASGMRKPSGIADWAERKRKANRQRQTIGQRFTLNAPGSTPETVAMIRAELASEPLRRLQDEWDREGLALQMRLLRGLARRQPDIDRFTAYFAYAVLSAAALVAIFHAARYAARVWGAA